LKSEKNVKYVFSNTGLDVHDDMTFKIIRGQGQGHVRLKVSKMTIFKFYLIRHFSTNPKIPTVSDARPKYLKALRPDF